MADFVVECSKIAGQERWVKEKTHREKDRADLQFLRENYAEEIFGAGGEG